MTELEYEKVCRGPLGVVSHAYAWGSTNIIRALYLSGTENGTETVATLNANANFYNFFPSVFRNTTNEAPPGFIHYSNWGSSTSYAWSAISSPNCSQVNPTYPTSSSTTRYFGFVPLLMCGSNASHGFGPLGVGIFARDTTLTREQTGAAYYGAMEMSGNVWEQCVNVNDAASLAYTGEWGDGLLSSNGKANVSGWPGGENTVTTIALRGGGYGSCDESNVYWNTDPNFKAWRLRISDRIFYNINSASFTNRNTYYTWPSGHAGQYGDKGGRGVR
jgi:hypothetical protein